MSSFKDLTGLKFGRLIVIGIAGKKKPGRYLWECICDCEKQNKIIVNPSGLKSGKTSSCGCITSPGPIEFDERIKRRLAVNSRWNGDCLEWVGNQKHHFGYGLISIKKKWTMTHRAAYEQHVGIIPEGLCVCHKCDNPPCINPEHLFLGTLKENMEDMVKKGRQNNKLKASPCERNPSAKLTRDQAKEIFIRRGKGEIALDLAKEFNVSRPTIYKIAGKRSWKELDR